jgi:hypothetical protein
MPVWQYNLFMDDFWIGVVDGTEVIRKSNDPGNIFFTTNLILYR